MNRSNAPTLNNRRKRLLVLVKKYYAAINAGSVLGVEEQAELEQLVTSELHMPLDKARVVLEHLARQSPDEDTPDEDTGDLPDDDEEK